MPTQPDADPVRLQIEALRKKLLDLTLRNRMLNYRPSKRLGITVVGESSLEVHRLLVEEAKKMSFEGRPDPPRNPSGSREIPGLEDDVAMAEFRRAAEEEMDAYLLNAAMPRNQMDTKLGTEEFESVLQAKLRTVMREANLADEELGINTLFLTLGTLEWCETDQRTFCAPLLFVPVKLEKLANGSIRVLHDGSDVGENLPLRAKIAEFNFRLPVYDDEKTVLDYFDEVESTVRKRADWTVQRNDICLAFFNYEKYAMYVDLGGDSWPEDRKPWQNPDAIAMLGTGYGSPESDIDDHSFIDDHRPIAEAREVYDADSSQTLAILRAQAGLSVVVEGPPGTGKSQTITNIIAESVAAGKSVLFVSAKRAALDVVKRRLEEAELGAMCLDLHDKMTNRREFYSEIKRTVSRSMRVRDEEVRVARLASLQKQLNEHSAAMNEVLPEFGLTVFEAMSRLAHLPKEGSEDIPGRVPFTSLHGFTRSDIDARTSAVQAHQSRLANLGIPSKHPFFGAKIDRIDPALRLDLEEALMRAEGALNVGMRAFGEARAALNIDIPGTADNAQVLRECAERALTAPNLAGVAIKSDRWADLEPATRHVIEKLRLRNLLKAQRDPQVDSAIYHAPIESMARAYGQHAGKWYRFLIGDFREARRALRSHLSTAGPTDAEGQKQLLDDLVAVRLAESEIGEADMQLSDLFGSKWQGLATQPEVLERLLEWVLDLCRDVAAGEVPAGLFDFLNAGAASEDIVLLAMNAVELGAAAISACAHAAQLLAFDASGFRRERYEKLSELIQGWQSAMPTLASYIAMSESRRRLVEVGLEPVATIADDWPLASGRLLDAFLRSYYAGVVRQAVDASPPLRAFERASHENAIAEFCSLDDFKLRYNRAQVRLAHHRNLPTFETAIGNLQLLKVQCELQRKHKPIRWIMSRAGEAIQRIKPVFMMSPLSVAIHLPPDLPPFDVVIFDEASQIKPEDAFCAIVRAKQAIVVGDTRQMPPTSFFDRIADDDEFEEESDESQELGQEARKLESILSLMSAVALGRIRRPDLRWHYRSVHPTLIQPSNQMFYENRLVVFPSPSPFQSGKRIGIVFHHHPDTVYEGGSRKRFNVREAEIVAQAVLRHVTETPEESLMVAAMNKSQADLIYAEVAKLERLNPDVFAAFHELHPHERLDVKNLENVQGDERDVVYISITYGRDSGGVIRQQFGPLLRDGGERRLNVLITRARRRCEVFSNMAAEDLRAESGQVGVASLKKYLKFAQTGEMEVPIETGLDTESPFEAEVLAILQDRGYDARTQIGTEGYRIDLAVADPDHPGRYVLGIECDGATYHSARSARDRDKLRQRVLEARGWKLHRIWSSDWWHDRDAEVERLVAAIESARRRQVEATPRSEPASVEPIIEESLRAVEKPTLAPYRVTPAPSAIQSDNDLANYAYQVVHHEGPICHDLLVLRLRDAAGIGRTGTKVREWIENAIRRLVNDRYASILEDGCYVGRQDQLAALRNWSVAPNKRAEFVPRVEIANAILHVTRSSYGADPESAVRGAFRLIGFERVGASAKELGNSVVRELIEKGSLADKDGHLSAV